MSSQYEGYAAFYKAFGKRVQGFRKITGLNAAEVGAKIGASRGYVTRMESGGLPISFPWMMKFSALYKVSLDDLFPSPSEVLDGSNC